MILGRGGAGKSALARKLGEVTGLPVVELDALFWQPGRWIWAYRRRSLPKVMRAITTDAPHADVHVLRGPRGVRRLVARL